MIAFDILFNTGAHHLNSDIFIYYTGKSPLIFICVENFNVLEMGLENMLTIDGVCTEKFYLCVYACIYVCMCVLVCMNPCSFFVCLSKGIFR